MSSDRKIRVGDCRPRASARSSSRFISAIRTPRCMRSAAAIGRSSTRCGDRFGVKTRYTDYDALLAGSERRRRPHQLADCRSRAAVDRGAEGRQARREHGAGRDDRRRVPPDRRVAAQERQGLHDDGDRRLQPRVSVREGAVRLGRARPHPVPPRKPSAGHGRLARILGRLSADALRDALREPVPRARSASTPSTSSATDRDGSTKR